MSSFYRVVVVGLLLLGSFWYLGSGASAFSGPQVSSGSLPVHQVYVNCSNGSPTDFFTNNSADTFVITEIWMGPNVAGYQGHSRLYLDGTRVLRLAVNAHESKDLQTRSGIAVNSGQTLSCDRLYSWGVEVTLIGYYAHTP